MLRRSARSDDDNPAVGRKGHIRGVVRPAGKIRADKTADTETLIERAVGVLPNHLEIALPAVVIENASGDDDSAVRLLHEFRTAFDSARNVG